MPFSDIWIGFPPEPDPARDMSNQFGGQKRKSSFYSFADLWQRIIAQLLKVKAPSLHSAEFRLDPEFPEFSSRRKASKSAWEQTSSMDSKDAARP